MNIHAVFQTTDPGSKGFFTSHFLTGDVLWSRGSRRRAGETSAGRRDGGKTKERKTYDYLGDEFERVEWRECNRTHETGEQQGGVEKKWQKMGALKAAPDKEQIMMMMMMYS